MLILLLPVCLLGGRGSRSGSPFLSWGQVAELCPAGPSQICWAACADPSPPQAMRTLSWKHTLGLVTMDVELADRTLSVAVTPVQAVVLLYFQDQGKPTRP